MTLHSDINCSVDILEMGLCIDLVVSMSSEHSIGSRFLSFAHLLVERGDPVSISTLYLSTPHTPPPR